MQLATLKPSSSPSCMFLRQRYPAQWGKHHVNLLNLNVLSGCTSRLVRRHASSTAYTGPDLIEWVKQNGGKVDGVSLVNLTETEGTGSGWGMVAAHDVTAGEKLIELPDGCSLTYNVDGDDPKLLALINKVPKELWGAKVALKLLAQRVQGSSSKWFTYIHNLPIGVQGVPIFYQKSAIDALEYAPVKVQIIKRCRWMAEFAATTLAPVCGTPHDPFNGYLVDVNSLGWALTMVTSRAFRTRGPAHPAAMLPLIDMANHDFDKVNVEVLPLPGGGGVGLYAKKRVAAGGPLLLNYGSLSNDFLLLDYGFVVEDNPHDTLELSWSQDLLQTGALISSVEIPHGGGGSPPKWQAAVLEGLRLEGPEADRKVEVGGPGHVSPRLLAACRLVLCKEPGELLGRPPSALGEWGKPLSKRNEVAALKLVTGMCAMVLGGSFSTTLDEDLAGLQAGVVPVPQGADPSDAAAAPAPAAASTPAAAPAPAAAPVPLTPDMEMAVRFRAEKKKVLRNVIKALQARMKAVADDDSLRLTSAGASSPATAGKGAKPAAATSKGFGRQVA